MNNAISSALHHATNHGASNGRTDRLQALDLLRQIITTQNLWRVSPVYVIGTDGCHLCKDAHKMLALCIKTLGSNHTTSSVPCTHHDLCLDRVYSNTVHANTTHLNGASLDIIDFIDLLPNEASVALLQSIPIILTPKKHLFYPFSLMDIVALLQNLHD